MASLRNETKNAAISQEVLLAQSFLKRGWGLLGKSELPKNQVLWIRPSNNIHTLFMRFALDVVFVDKNLVVKSVHRNVRPWKPLVFSWGAHSVFEFSAGTLESTSIEVGDQLNVSS